MTLQKLASKNIQAFRTDLQGTIVFTSDGSNITVNNIATTTTATNIPENAPYQISQIAINFICSMQYNTFRQAKKVPMATTFCTNHLRQTGIGLVKWIRHQGDWTYLKRMGCHVGMLSVFIVGGVISTILCRIFLGKAIWGAAIILIIIFIDLLHADLKTEKGMLNLIPNGH